MGLAGVSRRKGTRTTRRASDGATAPDLVQRAFSAQAPDRLWVADITYVPTWAGFIYLAVVLDAFSRRVVGWAMANHLRTELVLEALNMALWQRRPDEVIHHSDQGTQYTSIAFGKRCREFGVRPSMGSVGECYDNAMAESFFATLECECIEHEGPFRTQAEAKLAVFRFIEGWYNLHRRHSSLGYLSPHAYEQAVVTAAQADPQATPGMGRGEIVAPGPSYELDLRAQRSHSRYELIKTIERPTTTSGDLVAPPSISGPECLAWVAVRKRATVDNAREWRVYWA